MHLIANVAQWSCDTYFYRLWRILSARGWSRPLEYPTLQSPRRKIYCVRPRSCQLSIRWNVICIFNKRNLRNIATKRVHIVHTKLYVFLHLNWSHKTDHSHHSICLCVYTELKKCCSGSGLVQETRLALHPINYVSK